MQLTSIGKMFSSELTLASAWIHLLVVDLFAARSYNYLFIYLFIPFRQIFLLISGLSFINDILTQI
jgi:hypothetical protein